LFAASVSVHGFVRLLDIPRQKPVNFSPALNFNDAATQIIDPAGQFTIQPKFEELGHRRYA
jgi:hypothetical protein